MAQNIAFWILAVAMAGGAIGVVRSPNIVHAALFLVVVLAGAAAQYIVLLAEFVGMVQVLIYIGAIIVLFLFGIMLDAGADGADGDLDNDQRWPAASSSLFLLGVLSRLLLDGPFGDDKIQLNDQLLESSRTGRGRRLDLPQLRDPVRGRVDAAARRARRRRRDRAEGLMLATDVTLNQYLILSAFLFCTGVYGVLARRNGVLVLLCVELMLNAVVINLVAFSAFTRRGLGPGVRPVRDHDRGRRGRRGPGDRAPHLPQPAESGSRRGRPAEGLIPPC